MKCPSCPYILVPTQQQWIAFRPAILRTLDEHTLSACSDVKTCQGEIGDLAVYVNGGHRSKWSTVYEKKKQNFTTSHTTSTFNAASQCE
ncbi:hypothetical protein SFRURICE_008377 [Spodoptera frugiperda]|uniref:SFRICE_038017 n=1 Tax=Spodoptera frugiperda TaxID=7108 RepID=A0A2H1W451_SPOFR|nr:hypothetical protein SFRURICE_008377 [Spodoptera frugiperda]